MVQHVLFSKRQRLHDGSRLCDVPGVQEENTSLAVFSRVPFADFPIDIELDCRSYLGRHDGHDLLACYAGLCFQQRKDTCGH